MLRHYQPPNLTIMDAIERKELLHLRIEQANEEMQIVLAKIVEALFQTYQPEVIETETFVAESEEEAEKMAAYEATLKPMSKQELLSEIREGIADYHRGDYITLDELEKEAEAC